MVNLFQFHTLYWRICPFNDPTAVSNSKNGIIYTSKERYESTWDIPRGKRLGGHSIGITSMRTSRSKTGERKEKYYDKERNMFGLEERLLELIKSKRSSEYLDTNAKVQ